MLSFTDTLGLIVNTPTATLSPQETLELGLSYYHENLYDDAIKTFSILIDEYDNQLEEKHESTINENYVISSFHRGICYMQINNRHKAKQDFLAGMQSDIHGTALDQNTKDIILGYIKDFEHQDYPLTPDAAPSHKLDHFELAKRYFKRNDLNNSLKHINLACWLNPLSADALLFRSDILNEMAFDLDINCLSRAIQNRVYAAWLINAKADTKTQIDSKKVLKEVSTLLKKLQGWQRTLKDRAEMEALFKNILLTQPSAELTPNDFDLAPIIAHLITLDMRLQTSKDTETIAKVFFNLYRHDINKITKSECDKVKKLLAQPSAVKSKKILDDFSNEINKLHKKNDFPKIIDTFNTFINNNPRHANLYNELAKYYLLWDPVKYISSAESALNEALWLFQSKLDEYCTSLLPYYAQLRCIHLWKLEIDKSVDAHKKTQELTKDKFKARDQKIYFDEITKVLQRKNDLSVEIQIKLHSIMRQLDLSSKKTALILRFSDNKLIASNHIMLTNGKLFEEKNTISTTPPSTIIAPPTSSATPTAENIALGTSITKPPMITGPDENKTPQHPVEEPSATNIDSQEPSKQTSSDEKIETPQALIEEQKQAIEFAAQDKARNAIEEAEKREQRKNEKTKEKKETPQTLTEEQMKAMKLAAQDKIRKEKEEAEKTEKIKNEQAEMKAQRENQIAEKNAKREKIKAAKKRKKARRRERKENSDHGTFPHAHPENFSASDTESDNEQPGHPIDKNETSSTEKNIPTPGKITLSVSTQTENPDSNIAPVKQNSIETAATTTLVELKFTDLEQEQQKKIKSLHSENRKLVDLSNVIIKKSSEDQKKIMELEEKLNQMAATDKITTENQLIIAAYEEKIRQLETTIAAQGSMIHQQTCHINMLNQLLFLPQPTITNISPINLSTPGTYANNPHRFQEIQQTPRQFNSGTKQQHYKNGKTF